MYGLRLAVYLLLVWSTAAHAHEFWIEPQRFEIGPSQNIVADLRVGQYFKGDSQTYLPANFVAFKVIDQAQTRPVKGRLGDMPAVDIPARENGLHVVVYQSTPSSLTYDDLDDFASFARKQGLGWAVEAHRRRGLNSTDIKEAYTRYAKSLVRVGDGEGNDRPVGMPLELVAETNPYTTEVDEDITVRLLWQGEGRADAQVTVFRKHSECRTSRITLQTDAEGRAVVPRGPGGRLLVNAVHLTEPGDDLPDRMNAAWQSLWASLTFGLPEQTVDEASARCKPKDHPPPVVR